MADLSGVSRTLISSIELGRHELRLQTLIDIAEALGITFEIPLKQVGIDDD